MDNDTKIKHKGVPRQGRTERLAEILDRRLGG